MTTSAQFQDIVLKIENSLNNISNSNKQNKDMLESFELLIKRFNAANEQFRIAYRNINTGMKKVYNDLLNLDQQFNQKIETQIKKLSENVSNVNSEVNNSVTKFQTSIDGYSTNFALGFRELSDNFKHDMAINMGMVNDNLTNLNQLIDQYSQFYDHVFEKLVSVIKSDVLPLFDDKFADLNIAQDKFRQYIDNFYNDLGNAIVPLNEKITDCINNLNYKFDDVAERIGYFAEKFSKDVDENLNYIAGKFFEEISAGLNNINNSLISFNSIVEKNNEIYNNIHEEIRLFIENEAAYMIDRKLLPLENKIAELQKIQEENYKLSGKRETNSKAMMFCILFVSITNLIMFIYILYSNILNNISQ